MTPPADLQAASVEDIAVEDEMRQAFTEYAMSVIVSRALPDIRDGLKPVQRRILYAMHALRMRPDGAYRKSSRVIGETLGKYHPHGDQAVYLALVKLAQPFSTRLPLIDGHGNFGSPDDGPAAARYTECRLAPAAMPLLTDLDYDTVDFADTYDGAESEPSVLPAALPNLLINGVAGIAVGMATNIPPHNPAETIAAARVLLADADASVEDLRQAMPGPDLPGGCEVVDDDIVGYYRDGKGSFRMRAVAETGRDSDGTHTITLTALPYGVGPVAVLEAVGRAVASGELEGVADIKDLSDRRTGLRLRVDVADGYHPEAVLAALHAHTPTEKRFTVNAVALDDGQPRTVGVRDLLAGFLAHRRTVVARRTRHRLAAAQRRAHLVEGLLATIERLDDAIAIIRRSQRADTAHRSLRKELGLSDEQATHVLDLPLRRLTRLDVQALVDEGKELAERIAGLEAILASDASLDAAVDADLVEVGGQFPEPRVSRLVSAADVDLSAPPPLTLPDEPCTVSLTVCGRIGVDPPDRRVRTVAVRDVLAAVADTTSRGQVGLVTDGGILHRVAVSSLPSAEGRGRGGPVADTGVHGRVVGCVPLDPPHGWLLATSDGKVKRVRADALAVSDEQPLVGLADGATVVGVLPVDDDSAEMVLVTGDGRGLRTALSGVRPQGRSAGGVAGVRTDDGPVLAVGLTSTGQPARIVLATAGGALRVLPADLLPARGRGGNGVRIVRFKAADGDRLAAATVIGGTPIAVGGGRTLTPPEADVKRDGVAVASDPPAEQVGVVRGSLP